MLFTNIKEEPKFQKYIENKLDDIDYTLTSQSQNSIVSQIKLEPSDHDIAAGSLIDNADVSSLNILKEEIDVSSDEGSNTNVLKKHELENEELDYFETDRMNITWPSKKKHIYSDLKYRSESGKNDIVLKNARVVLERIPSCKISAFKKMFKTSNTHQNDRKGRLGVVFMINHYCPACDKVIDRATTFYNTVNCKTCKKKMSLQCKKCNRLYTRPNAMYYHLMSQCYPQKMYECTECDFKTSMLISIQRHTRRVHSKNEEKFECSKCHKKLKNQYTLAFHTKLCNKEGRYSCTICHYKSHFKDQFDNHMQNHEKFKTLVEEGENTAKITANRIDDGDIPDPNSKDKSKMDYNKLKILKYYKRFCPFCDKTYENNSITNSSHCHVCKSKLLMQCLKCNSRYTDKIKIKNHLLKCILKVYYKCSICDHRTLWERNLRTHIQRFHTTIDPEDYKKCPKCDKLFKIIDDLNKHAKTCGEDWYPYNCDHCFFRTKCKKSIAFHVQAHMKTHRNKIKKNSRPRNCQKAYCSKCDALRQIVEHSNMMCPKCKHLMVFKCRECGVEMPTRKDMRYHESENHGYVYHECRNCDKAFLRLWNCKAHRKICKGGKSAEK